jgi:hypothetical protein
MTMDVHYTSVEEQDSLHNSRRRVIPEFCINGVWHRYEDFNDHLEDIRDANEPFRNLHCLVVLSAGDVLNCLVIQPTRVQKGQFRRYGVEIIRVKDYNLSVQDLKSVRNEDWLEYERISEDGKYTASIL